MFSDARSPDSSSWTNGPASNVGVFSVVLIYAVFASLWILLSDKVVAWAFTAPDQIILASTLKGWGFVAVTSLLLYGLIRRLLAADGVTRHSRGGWRPFVLPLALLVLAIVAMTAAAVFNTIIHEKEKEAASLRVIADLKVRQIEDWLSERRGDAHFVRSSRFWADMYHRWRDQNDAASGDTLLQRMNEFREFNSFQGVLLLSDQGQPLWDSERGPLVLTPDLKRTLEEMDPLTNAIPHLGPYRDDRGRFHLDFIVPLVADGERNGPIVILHADPSRHLFPLLQSWPVPSLSGETLLFRRDGDDVLFLNELRHRPRTDGMLRVPVSSDHLLAARVLRGESAIDRVTEAMDYRGVPVMGVVRPVQHTQWFLSAEIDRSEVYAKIARDVLWIGLAGLLALFMAFTGVHLFRQRQDLIATQYTGKIQAERIRALQLLDSIVESSTDAIFAKDTQGRYLLFNHESARITGKRPEEVIGRDDRTIFPPDQATQIMATDHQAMMNERSTNIRQELTTIDGRRTFLTTKGPLRDHRGEVIGLFGIARDMTESLRMEELLRQSEANYRLLAENAWDVIWVLDLNNGRFRYVSPSVQHLRGYTAEEVMAEEMSAAVTPESQRYLQKIIPERLAAFNRAESADFYSDEIDQPHKNGTVIATEVTTRYIRNPLTGNHEVVGVSRDITQRKRAETALRDSLEEKVALLKEVHHRVKNNLQIVASLLNLQASRSSNREVLDVLQDTGNRIRSMALLHEALYRSENLARINFAEYVKQLCTQLLRSAGPLAEKARLDIRIGQVGLNMEQALPCGLIISELVTNSLKHGFPDTRSGRIIVHLEPGEERCLLLRVEDNGVGLPPEFDLDGANTLGLKLVTNLAGQLGGHLAVDTPPQGGCVFSLSFCIEPLAPV